MQSPSDLSRRFGQQETAPQNIFLEPAQESDQQTLITSNNTFIPSTNFQNTSYLNGTNAINVNYSAPLSEVLNPSMINTLNHKVNKGEYVYKLSRMYEVVPEDIMEWNSTSINLIVKRAIRRNNTDFLFSRLMG